MDESEAPSATLDRLLGLAAAARIAERSPYWKTDVHSTMEVHGDACEAVWGELNRLLELREAGGSPVKPPAPDDQHKKIKKQLLDELKIELPAAVKRILDNAA